jgi:hypothetical protein
MRKIVHIIILIALLWSLLPPPRIAWAQSCNTFNFANSALPAELTKVWGLPSTSGLQGEPDGEVDRVQVVAQQFQSISSIRYQLFNYQSPPYTLTVVSDVLGNDLQFSINAALGTQTLGWTGITYFRLTIEGPHDPLAAAFGLQWLEICGQLAPTPGPTPTPDPTFTPGPTSTPGPTPTNPIVPLGTPTNPILPQGGSGWDTWLEPGVEAQTGPTICTGWLYRNLKNQLDSILYPIFFIGRATKAWNSSSAKDTAGSILSPISNFLGYITFFNSLTPAFTSLSTLLLLYLIILSIKASLSLVRWLKQIIPYLG